MIATNNFFNTIGIILAAAIHWFLNSALQLSSDWIVFLIGILTLMATAIVLLVLPDYFVRLVAWLLTHTLYRIRVAGEENAPVRSPALLVSNHVSFVDALLIGACLPGFVRFMLHRDYYENKWLNWFFRLMKSIPIRATHRRDVVNSLKLARQELEAGHVVCIFAEGAITRTGHILPFKRGFEKVVEGTSVPIIPVHLDQVWGSVFSFHGGRFFWKWPKLFPYPVTVSFGKPLPANSTVNQVRQAVLELASEAARVSSQTYRFVACQIRSDGQAPVVFLLYGRHHRHRTYLRQDFDRQHVAVPLGERALPERQNGGGHAPGFGRWRAGKPRDHAGGKGAG